MGGGERCDSTKMRAHCAPAQTELLAPAKTANGGNDGTTRRAAECKACTRQRNEHTHGFANGELVLLVAPLNYSQGRGWVYSGCRASIVNGGNVSAAEARAAAAASGDSRLGRAND